MTTIGPTFPAHIAVSQAEVRLVADQTANADASTIKLDHQSLQTAERIEQEAARLSALDIVTCAGRSIALEAVIESIPIRPDQTCRRCREMDRQNERIGICDGG